MEPVITGALVGAVANLVTSWIQHQGRKNISRNTFDFERWRHQDNKAFQQERFEEEKKLQKELAVQRYQEQLSLAAVQRQTALDTIEWKAELDDFPLRIVPRRILEAYARYTTFDSPMPLLVLLAPPEVGADPFLGKSTALPASEKLISETVRDLLRSYADEEHPVKFMAGVWDSKRHSAETAFEKLFGMLGSVPTLVVESEIDGRFLNLRVGLWSSEQKEPLVAPIVSRLNCEYLLAEMARSDARVWETDRELYVNRGFNDEQLLEVGGDDERNLRVLREEQRDAREGIRRPRTYRIGEKQWEKLFQQLGACHSLLIGCLADVYHLQTRSVPPRLPRLLAEGLGGPGLLDPTVARFLASCYQQVFTSLETRMPHWLPDLYLQAAIGFAALPGAPEAAGLVHEALVRWLQLRGVEMDGEDPFDLVLARVGPRDRPLVRVLHALAVSTGSHERAVCLQGLLQSWQHQIATGQVNEDETGLIIRDF